MSTDDRYRSNDAYPAPQPVHPYQQYESEDRRISRTPSPTPSEQAALAQTGFVDWKKLTTFKRENIVIYIVIALILALVIVTAVLHNQIIKALQPAANWMHKLPAGWLIPVAILFVISFPPLFGQEIVALMCGVVWGAGIGFAIVCLGSFLGELANFFTFKYCCRTRSEKIRSTNIRYACLSKVVQEGGVKVAIIARYSVIPEHIITAIFATCGMSLWTFVISAIASMPKQFINVYIGVTFESTANGSSGGKSQLINTIVTVLTIAVTIFAMRYMRAQVNAVKADVIYARRKARQVHTSTKYGNDSYYPGADESTIALNPGADSDSSYAPHTTYPPTYHNTQRV